MSNNFTFQSAFLTSTLMKKTSSFGRPALLPGEAGYGVNQTEVLERDTRAMEAQLQMLQVCL